MKKWIRWQGLAIFIGVIALFCILWFFFIDGIVKRTIEKYGTQAIGAKVELASADLTLLPAGLKLKGLQITNPNDPMKNAVEVDRIYMDFDTKNLFRRKFLVEQMEVLGMRFNTPRNTSGALQGLGAKRKGEKAIRKTKERKSIFKGATLASLSKPSVKDILNREKLPSLELANSLKAQIQKEQEKWQERLASLPDKNTFESYRAEIQQLLSGTGGIEGVLTSGSRVMKLKKKIKADIGRLRKANQDFQNEVASLKQKIAEAKRAPFKDATRLAHKYGLSEQGLANLSRIIFAPKISKWIEKAAEWYERVQPLLERRKEKKGNKALVKPHRGKGLYVKFKERQPLPDFLIKKAKASVVTRSGNILGTIKNITPDQDILGKPLTFSFKAEKLKQLKLIEANGVLNHIKAQEPKDKIKFVVKGFYARQIPLLEKFETPILIKKALIDLYVKTTLQGQHIKADIFAAFDSVNFSFQMSGADSPIMNGMLSALKGVKNFVVEAKVRGTVKNYEIRISSDLDGILRKSVEKLLTEQTQQLRQELGQAIMAKVSGPLSEAEDGLYSLGRIGEELTKRLNLGTGLLGHLPNQGSRLW